MVMVDFEIYEGEDISLRYTIVDVNNDLQSITGNVILAWTATHEVGGVPVLQYYSNDPMQSIEKAPPKTNALTCDVHIDGDDTRNVLGILYSELSVYKNSARRVLRHPPGKTGAFRIIESDTDERHA